MDGVHLTLPSHIFFCPSKVWSMLHHGSVGVSSEKNKINLTLTLNLLLFFIITFVSLSGFLRLYHFYSLFTAYLLYVEVMPVRPYVTVLHCSAKLGSTLGWNSLNRFLVNSHVTLSNFKPLLRKFKYFITALINEQLLL